MKACLHCNTPNPSDVFTCSACGQGSWGGEIPEEPKADPSAVVVTVIEPIKVDQYQRKGGR